MERINVTKTFLPPQAEYGVFLRRIWESGYITNQGPLLLELEAKLRDKLDVPYLHFVGNGTLALQLALRALDIEGGEVITTPFSYVATTSAILWERCKPVFVDIEPETFCMDPDKIEAAITPKTKAILPVHVFGNPCHTEKIEAIARKHNLKVIYDAAHAFGVQKDGKTLLGFGDVSICSFHATKAFHAIEGGCLVTHDPAVSEKIELLKRFGHNGDDHQMLGMNAKASEFHAAMGLANLGHFDAGVSSRRSVRELYDKLLAPKYRRPIYGDESTHNFAYYPVLLHSEVELERVMADLKSENIFPRRYFYPSLNTLHYLPAKQSMPISEDIASRIICLPIYHGLAESDINRICEVLNR